MYKFCNSPKFDLMSLNGKIYRHNEPIDDVPKSPTLGDEHSGVSIIKTTDAEIPFVVLVNDFMNALYPCKTACYKKEARAISCERMNGERLTWTQHGPYESPHEDSPMVWLEKHYDN